tara:strand:+ start:2039 stop:3271 length:1233 start_codon:yes stop_codon:yes gene_type:complete
MGAENKLMRNPEKIIVKDLYKIFNDADDEVMQLIEDGYTKDEILEKTGSIVGVCKANFSVKEGEIFVIMGLSGSGKSTLVRLLNRLIEPSCGEVHFDGLDITNMPIKDLMDFRRKKVNMVFQSFALMPHMNVVDNAAFGLELSGVGHNDRHSRAREALSQVGLEAFAEHYPDELSGGMQQRVGLARALACDPSVMLMDEAFSALDPLIRAEMQDELLKLQEKNRRTIIFITHDLDEAMRIGDRIAIMESGRVIQIGKPEEILRNPTNEYVASFFRGVDTSNILSAKHIAMKSQIETVQEDQTLETVLNYLNQIPSPFCYVLNQNNNLVGIVSELSIKQAMTEDPKKAITKALVADLTTLHEDTLLRDLIGIVSSSPYGVPVINRSDKYLGAITKTTLLNALNQRLKKENG